MIEHLPQDWERATLLGRIETAEGPSPILARGGRVYDVSRVAPASAECAARWAAGDKLDGGVDIGALADLGARRAWAVGAGAALLAPVDLQCVKAAGVTFAVSALERVIEERARGDAAKADSIRASLAARVGLDALAVKPGSPEAARLKAALIEEGYWSQYLEVAIGPDAEVFTKAPVLAAVGWGALIGVRADSYWSNPEPEVVLVCDGEGRAVGAALGNDVNLRDIEGRSALLLGKAKDNNASCAIGPFIRLFDEHFSIDDVRSAEVRLEIEGEDGFTLAGASQMRRISRDPLDLAAQTLSRHHQYPDGFALFLGTMFAPIEDRGEPGRGFTHKSGDIVRIASERLGVLENKVAACHEAPPWRFGVGALMRNLARRGLLA
jgi:fumarylacetoacetate (FAA) hydrolase family protein